jgi:hypothetical protein
VTAAAHARDPSLGLAAMSIEFGMADGSPTYLARLSNVPANLETAERDELATALVARHER